jgi:hypothetical protein
MSFAGADDEHAQHPAAVTATTSRFSSVYPVDFDMTSSADEEDDECHRRGLTAINYEDGGDAAVVVVGELAVTPSDSGIGGGPAA